MNPADDSRFSARKYLKNDPDFQLSIIDDLIACIDPEPDRPGLKDTPRRVVESWKELFAGYAMKPDEILKEFDGEGYDEMVLVKDIEFYSTCEHHLLQVVGHAHVAYIPQTLGVNELGKLVPIPGKVFGLSKLARLVDCFARRLTMQERVTKQVVEALLPKVAGAACVVEAIHFCMCSRGVGKSRSKTVTSYLRGPFFDKPAARAELFSLINGR